MTSFSCMTVAELMADTLARLELRYPEVSQADRQRFEEMRQVLEAEPD